jgi:hypothetical protein
LGSRDSPRAITAASTMTQAWRFSPKLPKTSNQPIGSRLRSNPAPSSQIISFVSPVLYGLWADAKLTTTIPNAASPEYRNSS